MSLATLLSLATLAAWLCSAAAQLQNVDHVGKASVKLSNLYDRGSAPDNTWPPAQEYARTDMSVMGRRVQPKTLRLLPRLEGVPSRKLERILGQRLDADWVSVGDPSAAANASLPPQQDAFHRQLVAQLGQLDFSNMKDDLGNVVVFDQKAVYMFKTWLTRRASCPVNYVWENLGELFWPRHIRRGICGFGSCSFPAGMSCRMASRKTLKLLRWVCVGEGEEAAGIERELRRSADRQRNRRRNRRNRRKRRGRRRQRRNRRNRRKSSSSPLPAGWQRRRADRLERRRRRLVLKLSRKVDGYFCYWKLISYDVISSCACTCN